MNTISLKNQFLPNNKIDSYSYFPLKVRASAAQRVQRHSLSFAGLNAAFSMSYHLITLNFMFAMKQAAKSFLHKGSIGLIFFYTNQVLRGWVQGEMESLPTNKQAQDYRISAWSTYCLSSMLLLPVFIGINSVYRLPVRKTLMKSVVDGLLLTLFGLEMDRNIRTCRKILIKGKQAQKKGLIHP